MGHGVAQQVGMSLLARCSGHHFLLLSGAERLVFEPDWLAALETARTLRTA
jgi:FdhD protein